MSELATMELRELQAFAKVVQGGSFTRAAESMGSQKAHLSRQVSALERKLGVRLLQRSTRSMHLTEVGREVYERTLGILGAVADTARIAQRTQAEPSGTLKLTCGVEFGMIAVNGWIGRYLERYPQMAVEAEFTGRVLDLVHEGFDLAIRVGELSDSSLVARRLGELRYGLFASPAYVKRHGRPRHPDDLGRHALLAFSPGSRREAWRLHNAGEEAKVNPAARLRVNNHFAVRDAALAGLGIAQLPLRVAQPSLASGALLPLLKDWTLPQVPVHAVFSSQRFLSAKLRAFVDLAVREFDA